MLKYLHSCGNWNTKVLFDLPSRCLPRHLMPPTFCRRHWSNVMQKPASAIFNMHIVVLLKLLIMVLNCLINHAWELDNPTICIGVRCHQYLTDEIRGCHYLTPLTKWPSFRGRYIHIHFPEWKVLYLLKLSLKFIPKGPIDNISLLV